MHERPTPMTLARSIRVLVVLFATTPLSLVQAQDATKACSDAAQVLVNASSSVRVSAETARSTTAQRTLAWTSSSGHAGDCRFDSSGRLYSVNVSRFPETAHGDDASYSISCESVNNRRRECRLRSAPSMAILERQLSKSSCVQGNTFGVTGSVLWVDRGCRGRFKITPLWETYSLSCASTGFRRQECRTRGNAVARLARRTSRSQCVEGQSWGHAGSILWVDRGCAGVFEISPTYGSDDRRGVDQARNACRQRLQSQGLSVREELGVRSVGNYIELTLGTRSGQVNTTIICSYDTTTGRVQTRAW